MKNSTPQKCKKTNTNQFKDNCITRDLEKGGQIETKRPEKLAKLINVNLSVSILVKPCELSPTNHENMKIWKLFYFFIKINENLANL